MKKPVRKKPEEIEAIAAKRKNQRVYEQRAVPSGNLAKITEAFKEFSEKFGVPLDEVKITTGYYPRMIGTRQETDEEKFARIKREENRKYTSAKWDYDAWVRNEKYRLEQEEINALRRAQAERNIAKVASNQCCPSNCCCRR